MEFEWDEFKNRSNFRKHGVSFEDARNVFNSFPVIYFDIDNSVDEDYLGSESVEI